MPILSARVWVPNTMRSPLSNLMIPSPLILLKSSLYYTNVQIFQFFFYQKFRNYFLSLEIGEPYIGICPLGTGIFLNVSNVGKKSHSFKALCLDIMCKKISKMVSAIQDIFVFMSFLHLFILNYNFGHLLCTVLCIR